MQEEEYVVYQSFNSKYEALPLIDLLTKEEIPFKFKPSTETPNSEIFRAETDYLCLLSVLPSDFERVNALLEKNVVVPSEIPEDYYLLQFSNEELIDLLKHREEWSNEDVLIAEKILGARNIVFDVTAIEEERKQRIEKDFTPKKGSRVLIAVGVLTVLLGGLFGILVGWSFYTAKTTDPFGNRFYVYNKRTRSIGYYMIIVGIISWVSWTIYYYEVGFRMFGELGDRF